MPRIWDTSNKFIINSMFWPMTNQLKLTLNRCVRSTRNSSVLRLGGRSLQIHSGKEVSSKGIRNRILSAHNSPMKDPSRISLKVRTLKKTTICSGSAKSMTISFLEQTLFNRCTNANRTTLQVVFDFN